jgi:hypothetical protein
MLGEVMEELLQNIIRSVGPQQFEIAVVILESLGEGELGELLPAMKDAVAEGWRRAAQEFAQLNTQVAENTRQMQQNEHPTNFVAEGGVVFIKQERTKCPECGEVIVSAQFCENAMKESGGYGGLIMCVNNDFVQPQTEGTGECEYEAWLPAKPNQNKEPCEGCD